MKTYIAKFGFVLGALGWVSQEYHENINIVMYYEGHALGSKVYAWSYLAWMLETIIFLELDD